MSMTRSALCLRGNGALRVRLLPRADAGAAHQPAGAVAFKEITEPVDVAQLEWSCAAALSALQAGAVCQSDALRALSATQVQGTPLQLACLWHTALAVLVASGHAVRSGLWFTVRSCQLARDAHRTRRVGNCRCSAPHLMSSFTRRPPSRAASRWALPRCSATRPARARWPLT